MENEGRVSRKNGLGEYAGFQRVHAEGEMPMGYSEGEVREGTPGTQRGASLERDLRFVGQGMSQSHGRV